MSSTSLHVLGEVSFRKVAGARGEEEAYPVKCYGSVSELPCSGSACRKCYVLESSRLFIEPD